MANMHMTMQPMTRAEVVQKVQQHFAMLDTNKDGFVTRDEAKGARMEKMEMHAGNAFDRLDANHDGSITRQEFDAGHQAMAAHRAGRHGGGMAMHAGMMGHMFEMADANKDGRVSLQEATAAAAAHFDRVDANHDGTISTDEMRAAHQAMRARTGR
jgi:Ca2+-binding EF-hand superfamily protein